MLLNLISSYILIAKKIKLYVSGLIVSILNTACYLFYIKSNFSSAHYDFNVFDILISRYIQENIILFLLIVDLVSLTMIGYFYYKNRNYPH